MEAEFSIQQVAQLTGLSIDTLRYYERIELIEPIRRASNNHRRYTQEDVNWICLFIRLKETGMPLAQMVRFARMRREGPITLLTERRIMLEQHQHDLEQRIQQLKQHHAALQQKIVNYKETEALLADPSASVFSSDLPEKVRLNNLSLLLRKGTYMTITSPFHAHSTTSEVIAEHDLTGNVALVTGASSGLGIETARALLSAHEENPHNKETDVVGRRSRIAQKSLRSAQLRCRPQSARPGSVPVAPS